MSLVKKALFVLVIAALVYGLLRYPDNIPNEMEEPDFLRKAAPIFRLFGLISKGMWYIGAKNTMAANKILFDLLKKEEQPDPNVLQIYEKYFDGVRVLVFQPKKVDNNASILFFHGGGYVLGSPEMYAKLTTELALKLKSVVVSVDYRLAPEHVHPSMIEDVIKVTKHFFQQGFKDYQLDPKRITVMGDSAGGHIAAAVTNHFSKSKEVQIKATVLIYPVLQHLSHNTPSYIENDRDFLLSRWYMHVFRLLYYQGNSQDNYYNFQANNFTTLAIRKSYADKYDLPELVNRGEPKDDGEGDPQLIAKFKHLYEDPLNSPLFGDVSNYPPTYIVSCQYDVLRDDSFMLARRLKKANRFVKHVNVNSFHGFVSMFEEYQLGRRILDDILSFIQAHR